MALTENRPSAVPLLILVAGPYRSGTGDDPERIAANMKLMTDTSLVLFRRGHMPVTGEAIALPMIEAAGSQRIGDAAFDEIFHPLARRLFHKLDAVLRVGGASVGADEMVALAEARGIPVYRSVDEVPGTNAA